MFCSKIIRYLFVGGFCSILLILSSNLVFYFFSIEWLATIVGNIVGILCGYFLQMRITFKAKGEYQKRFVRYLILSLLMIGYSQGISLCFEIYGGSYMFCSIFIALSIPLFSYPLQKFWVFGERL